MLMTRAVALLAAALLAACGRAPDRERAAAGAPDSAPDSAFAALQARGEVVMGVDQWTSTHVFEDLPDGGRITLRRDVDDPAGVATIRAHMRDLERHFAAGDFTLSQVVHDGPVPGTDVMAARRDHIRYVADTAARGATLRITTTDSAALRAIHAFLAFQRSDHRAGGEHDHGGH
jgi:ketosteroid isomerase-like protein